jgi:hypothetical protein
LKHVARIVASDLGEVLREELLLTIIKVRVSVLVLLTYSSGHKYMRGKTHFREVSYPGFYTLEGF